MQPTNKTTLSVIQLCFAYIAWGFFPVLYSLFNTHLPQNIAINRAIWSFVCLFALSILNPKRTYMATPITCKLWWTSVVTALLLAINVGITIWAVGHGMVYETGIGDYMAPLVAGFLAVVALSERPSKQQILGICIASLGVFSMVCIHGKCPWIALVIAFTGTSYGIVKKRFQVPVIPGLFLESALLCAMAMVYYNTQATNSTPIWTIFDVSSPWLGVATVIPLICYTQATMRLPYMLVGMLQYLQPIIVFFCALWIFHEPWEIHKKILLAWITLALVVYFLPIKSKWWTCPI